MSGLEDARRACDSLRLLMGVSENEDVKKSRLRMGIVFCLLGKGGKIYIGSEYESNIVCLLKDLCVRNRSYEELGYLYDASNEVLSKGNVRYVELCRMMVSKKLELCDMVNDEILKWGNKCVNIWDACDILKRADVPGVLDGKDVEYNKFVKEKKKKENDVIKKLMKENGISKKESEFLLDNYRKDKMIEIRGKKDKMYEEKFDMSSKTSV